MKFVPDIKPWQVHNKGYVVISLKPDYVKQLVGHADRLRENADDGGKSSAK